MALSGNGIVKSSWDSRYGQKFYWKAVQNITGNYSDLTVDVYAYFENKGTIQVGARSDSRIGIAGTYYDKTYPAISKMSDGVKEVYLGSQTRRIYHGSDGKLNNVSITSEWPIRATISGTYRANMNVSYNTGPIDTIPRQANLMTANNFNDEGTPYMTFENPGGFDLDVYLEVNGTIVARRNNIPKTTSYTWALTEAERNTLRGFIPNSNSVVVKYVIATKVGGVLTWWSTANRSFTIVNASPTFTDFSYRDSNTTTVGVTGNNQVIIKGKSTLLVAISNVQKMVANKMATPKSYGVEIDGKSVSVPYVDGATERVIGTIDNVNNSTLVVRAIDSRNNSTQLTKTLTIVDYNKPVINATATRLNQFENETTLKVSGSISLVTVAGVNKNSISSLQYRRREAGGTWGAWTTLSYTMSGANFTAVDVIADLDNSKGYEYEIRCIDKLDQNIINRSVGIGVPAFFIDVLKNSIGVGMFPTKQNSVEVVGKIYQNGAELIGASVLEPSVDLDSIVKGGMYRLNGGVINGPPGANYGQLLVIRGGSDTIAQLVFPYHNDAIYRRSGNPSEVGGSGSWRPWVEMLSTANNADYVIESGSNSNGSWEKWASGKLVQRTVVRVAREAKSKSVDYTWTFPLVFASTEQPYYNGIFQPIEQGVAYRYGEISFLYHSNFNNLYARGKSEDGLQFDDYYFRLEAIGRWK